MIKVDIIYPGCITAPNGLSHFVGKMKELKPMFNENNIDLRVISADLYQPRQYPNQKSKPQRKTIIALWLAKHSFFITKLLFYLIYDKPSKQVLDYYETLPDKGDVLAFQDMITCYNYLKKHKKTDKKILLTIHGSGDMWSVWHYGYPKMKSKLFKPYKNNVEAVLLNGCDKIGFVADYPRRNFCKKYNYDERKTYYAYTSLESIGNPINIRISDKLRLITSGGLNERKNQMGVLNAIALLPKDYQEKVSYTILSDGELRNDLEKRAKSLFAEIVFTGKVEKVEDYLKKANCFILYSKDEGQPMSIVEAMRLGLPIIGSNVAGIPEQIDNGKSGFVVDLDEDSLSRILIYLIDHKEEIPRMGKASYELFLSKFTIEAMVKKYVDIYMGSKE